MPDEPEDILAELDDLGELLAQSQQLKEEAARLLRESAKLDERIEKVLKASIEAVKVRDRSSQ